MPTLTTTAPMVSPSANKRTCIYPHRSIDPGQQNPTPQQQQTAEGCCGGHGHGHNDGEEADEPPPPVARVVLPGDCVELDLEEEALAVVGTQGLKVRCWVVSWFVGGWVCLCVCGGDKGCVCV